MKEFEAFQLFQMEDCRDYAETRLIKKLKGALLSANEAFPVPSIDAQLLRGRYDLDELRGLPHVLALRSIFELAGLLQTFKRHLKFE